MTNATLLRQGRLAEIDADNIAEELEAMGKSEKRELVSRLSVLIANLLKWRHQAVKRSKSWKNTLMTQRIDIEDLLDDSPTLSHGMDEKIRKAYRRAKLIAKNETGIDKKIFPDTCPFTPEQILDKEFFPDE